MSRTLGGGSKTVHRISTYKLIDKTQHKAFFPDFHKFAGAVMKLRIPAFLIAVVIAVPCFIAQGETLSSMAASRIYSTDATQMGRDLLSVEEEYGASNPLVIMVPKGDTSKESVLSEELKDNENVTSVISYVDSVGQRSRTALFRRIHFHSFIQRITAVL